MVAVRPTVVPHTKLADVLSLKGVVFVPVAPAAMLG